MSAYDYIILKFILKSKTKWVDGLQFVLYLYLITEQIGMAEQQELNIILCIYILDFAPEVSLRYSEPLAISLCEKLSVVFCMSI